MSGSITTSHHHSRHSREVYFLWKRREKIDRDIESLQEDMINFSTLGRFHGRPYALAFDSPSIRLFLTFLGFRKWSSLEAHTKPPYILTLKSNGCIIFIAALSPSQLLITSKHSVGPVQGVHESHAQAGERWLHRHLGQVEKTTEELAKVLWEKHWTAVAEVSHSNSHPTERVFITRSSAMIASRSMFLPTPPKSQAYIYTVLTSAQRTSRHSRLPS